MIDRYPRYRLEGTRWILVEAEERVMGETLASLAEFATRELRRRGIGFGRRASRYSSDSQAPRRPSLCAGCT